MWVYFLTCPGCWWQSWRKYFCWYSFFKYVDPCFFQGRFSGQNNHILRTKNGKTRVNLEFVLSKPSREHFKDMLQSDDITAWKVPVFGVFLVRIFMTRKTLNTDTFHPVYTSVEVHIQCKTGIDCSEHAGRVYLMLPFSDKLKPRHS